MNLLIIVALVALFVLPSFLSLRRQRERQNMMTQVQNSLVPGQRVVTAGGIHGAVVETREGEVDLRLAEGFVVTFDKKAIIRSQDSPDAAVPAGGAADEGEAASASTASESVASAPEHQEGETAETGTAEAPRPDTRGDAK